jgi:hypothetical protein
MYAVGRADLGRARLHMGLIQSGNTAQPMLGFDAPLASRVTVQADYTAGSENSASIGFSISLGEEVGITAAMIRSNSGPERNNYMLLIGRYFSMPDLRRQPY